MGSCQLCNASGIGLKLTPCKRCNKQFCSKHGFALPAAKQQMLNDALSGRGGLFKSAAVSPQAATAWMANPASAPPAWQEFFVFCNPQCAGWFLGTLTPNTVQGPNGPVPILSFSGFGQGKTGGGMNIDYSKAASIDSVYALVESNMPPDLRPAFQARVSGQDFRRQNVERARTAWAAGNFNLAAQIYDQLGETAYAGQARELARTQTVMNVSVNFNTLVDQLKELRKPIAFTCPGCGAGAIIDAAISQERMKCQYCGNIFAVPDVMSAVNRMVSASSAGVKSAAGSGSPPTGQPGQAGPGQP